MTFTAKHRGVCESCGGAVEPGQEAAFDAGDRLVHAMCPDAPVRRERGVCPRCFLELPATGVCGDCDA